MCPQYWNAASPWNCGPSGFTAVLAKALDDQGLVGPFFAGLVEQEQYHVDLLELARAAAIRKGWKASLFNPWQDYLPRLEQQMDARRGSRIVKLTRLMPPYSW